jgi:hypothetical protein
MTRSAPRRASGWFEGLQCIFGRRRLRPAGARALQRQRRVFPRLEVLEERTLLTTNLYLDFGDNFTGARGLMDGANPVTHDSFVNKVNGPNLNLGNGIPGATPYTFTSFSALATTAGFNSTQIATMEADIVGTVQRYYEPFDVNVIPLFRDGRGSKSVGYTGP